MLKEGIKLEICTIATKVFNVDASSILPGIKQVHNGWISLIGYQSKGYALIPVY
jgi:intracellular sulfur oxidation DsrE/DsrF family protein